MAYYSLYDSDRFASDISGRSSVRINGRDLRSFGFMLNRMPNINMPPVRERLITIDNRSGSLDMGAVYDNFNFTIEGFIIGLTHDDLIKKYNALKAWIDIEQNHQTSFQVNQHEVHGLKFELSGQTLWYTDGTVDVLLNDATVSGNGTLFTKFLVPGSVFEVSGDSTRYEIANISADNSLELTSTVSRSNGSTLAYRAERRKYLLVSYSGNSSVSSVSNKGFFSQGSIDKSFSNQASNVLNVTIGLRTTYPYWIGDMFEHEDTTVSSGTFIELDGVGNAPFQPDIIHVVGATNGPKISTGPYAFHSTFNGSLRATDHTNSTVTGAYGAAADEKYRPTKFGLGAYVDSNDILYYSGPTINREQVSAIIRFRPQVASTSISDYSYVLHTYDSGSPNSDMIKVWFGYTSDNWHVSIGASDQIFTANNTAKFNADQDIELSFWYNINGVVDDKDGTTYYGKIFQDGEIIGTLTSAPTPSTVNMTSIIIGGRYASATPTATQQIDAVFDEVAIFNRSLSDDEIRRIYFRDEPLHNVNTYITSSNNLASNDVLYLSSSLDHRVWDESEHFVSNANTDITGNYPVIHGNEREKETVFVSTASGSIAKIRFTYRPRFR